MRFEHTIYSTSSNGVQQEGTQFNFRMMAKNTHCSQQLCMYKGEGHVSQFLALPFGKPSTLRVKGL